VKRADGLLRVDTPWYLVQQIHPPIARLCDPIEGTDAGMIAECLGLDPSKFRMRSVVQDGAGDDDKYFSPLTSVDSSERFKSVLPYSISCCSCNKAFPIDKGLVMCPHCEEFQPEPYVHNIMDMYFRTFVKKYYEFWMVCEEPSCKSRTRQLLYKPSKGAICPTPGCKGLMFPEVPPLYRDPNLPPLVF
jgi:DNA polymerase alpha subunit A